MANVRLVPHDLKYARRMFELVTAPELRAAIDIRDRTIEETKWFIVSAIEAEKMGEQVSRVILNEKNRLIGVTSLLYIDRRKKFCHLGTWLGLPYWGQGYNEASKVAILRIAFETLGMEAVLLGARTRNVRSQKAQAKLPYVTLGVESEFPEEHRFLEDKEREPCVLNAVYRADFINWLAAQQAQETEEM